MKNDEIAAMLRCSSLHMNNYAPPRALPDANLVIFSVPKANLVESV
jgi:hypothetical protein